MPTDEIVNPAADLSSKRWQLFQLFGPILGVILVIGTIALVTLYTYHTMRDGTIVLSRSLLRSQQRYITQEVSNYLSPAASTSAIARNVLNQADTAQDAASFMSIGRAILKNLSQVDSFYLADDTGRFWMMSRRKGHFEETSLQNDASGKSIYHYTLTDPDGRPLNSALFPNDDKYDPRDRPWYTGALHREDLVGKERIYWSDPYPHSSTHQFIITASIAFPSLGGRKFVFAINISLNQLTHFVNSLQVGHSGQAVIVDLDGRVIAGHNMAALETPGFDAANVHLNPDTQPVFLRALNIFRIRGDGAGVVHARGKDYVTIASAMPLAKQSWVLLLNAPESDFVSFTRKIQEQTIYFSLLIVGLASLLAFGLIYQGRRVSRLQSSLRFVGDEQHHENTLLLKVANTPGLLNPQQEIPVLSEVLVERSGSRRVSLWRLLPDNERLLCEDMFDAGRDAHAAGVELHKSSYPALFECLSETHILDIPDAEADERFQGFYRLVMQSLGSRRLLFWSIMEQHHPVGALMIEDPVNLEGIDRFVALASAVLSVRFTQQQKEEGSVEDLSLLKENTGANSQRGEKLRVLKGFLVNPEDGKKAVPEAGLYPRVPLMVLEFEEAYTSNTEVAKQMLKLVADLSGKIKKIAQESGLFSVQASGNRVVILGSCSQTFNTGDALRLADAAITIREACLAALTGVKTRLTFRIGLDVGPVIAAHLGMDPDVFNVWGEGLSVAELLAQSTPDGGQIQVSEQAYQGLRGYFLFRPRGDFYLPGSGVTRSYVLAGRR
ncbi:adenylate/guanylate cyclase domain-containing protein [Saccharibacter sp. 17.LH.SD]|uniref:cache domain-containing protein n=1 Tax=Saccharibacter sp. 17.LH.SD TaxID=2689393 RepID=UPI001371DC1B|nr:cache domain-containing protein [Saccharibacter sp. 17.LH.SD]MXV44493.1 adenylate/guanylate cyclase domain-containing protein [Saccharibacter sp. 17.LH.SD]